MKWETHSILFLANDAVSTIQFASGTASAWGPALDNVRVNAIPEPATVLVWALLGAASWLGMGVWRRGHNIGRRAWPEENRTAIHDIIARGGRD